MLELRPTLLLNRVDEAFREAPRYLITLAYPCLPTLAYLPLPTLTFPYLPTLAYPVNAMPA